MRAYLIDPEKCSIKMIELPDKNMLDEMHKLIGAETLDHQTISDEHDSVWVDDSGLKRGEPIYAFALPIQKEPFGGRAIVIGADDRGMTRAPVIPIWLLARDIEWLGEIVPEVVWEETEFRSRAIVTYTRVKK